MKADRITPEHSLYWLAFLLAMGVRLFQLGAAPLSDVEAGWALQALGLAHGGAVILGAQPAYILLTSQLFSVFGDTNFLARLFPALAGSLIIWLPCLFQRWMGDSRWLQRAGVVMAFGLAIDPGLISLSRQIGSPMPALAFTLLAFACLYNRHMIWAGIFTGLALLSGAAFLQGLLILGISWGLYSLAGRKFGKSEPEEGDPEPSSRSLSASLVRVGVSAFIFTLLVAGTLFLRAPQGLGALADTIPSYLNTWVSSSGIPVLRLPISLLVYEPLVLILAMISIVRIWAGTRDNQRTRLVMLGLLIWAVVALLLPLIYAGRQVGDLTWALIPLWALAAVEISRSMLTDEDMNTRLVAAGLGLFLCFLAVVGWIDLLSIGRYQVSMGIYWLDIIGAFALGSIAVLLVITGWSITAARLGMVWALCIVFGLQLVSNTWGMAILRQNGAQELWVPPPATGQVDELLVTLTDFSSWNTGLRDQLQIVVLADSPALKWAMRHFPNTRFETTLSANESPPVVITLKGTEEPKLTQQYRGQDFVWRLYPGWQGVVPPSFINWLAFRQAPLAEDQIILWARTDIFPGGGTGTIGGPTP